MKVLEVNNLNKSYGKKHVLKDVSFCLNEGEILAFIGLNGAGKTTTIKLILGLQNMDSGNVYINGIDNKKDLEGALKKVGAIVENPDMYAYLSGRQNLEMVARLYNDVTKEKIDELIKLVGLENRIDDKVSKYSLGMKQRLGIAVSLINSPNILILDEPTNGLDPEGIKELRSLLKKLAKKEKVAILISSHNLAELENFCTSVCIIKSGEIIKQCTVEELKSNVGEYIIELNDVSNINDVISDAIIIDSKHIKVSLNKEEIPILINKLIKEKYMIYEIKLNEVSLEDMFLEVTGGGLID